MSKVASSLLLSAGLLAAGAASAAETLVFDDFGQATFKAQHGPNTASYVDEYLFDLDTASWALGTATVGKWPVGGAKTYGISNIVFFWEDAGVRTYLGSTLDTSDGIDFYPTTALAAGSYGFIVTGSTQIAGQGGSYAGTLTLAPVPEPATYAMLGVGIGLLAFTARRKTNTKLG